MSQEYPIEGEMCECGGVWEYLGHSIDEETGEESEYEEHYRCDQCGEERFYD